MLTNPISIFLLALLALACTIPSSSVPAWADSTGDAKKCVLISKVPPSDDQPGHRTITNSCNEKIGLLFCHTPSAHPGTQSTECGDKGWYYREFVTLAPGETVGNPNNMPFDAKILYGACFGGERNMKQLSDGEYRCR